MEFKFRAFDDRPPPPYLSPTPADGPFSKPAGPELMRNPVEMSRELLREMEKQQIKEEILARRRVLEAEVRRELMMGREIAMHRPPEIRVPFEERVTMPLEPWDPFAHHCDGRWLDERVLLAGRWVANFDVFPQPTLPPIRLPETWGSEVKAAPEKKRKLIVLPKPAPTLPGLKQNAFPAADAGELPVIALKKKPSEEWSCALCKVSATSEKGLNEHLQGKKHKSKEAALRAQNVKKSSQNQVPPKRGKPSKAAELPAITGLGSGMQAGIPSVLDTTDNGSELKPEDTGKLKQKIDPLPMEKNHNSEGPRNKFGKRRMDRVERTPEFREKKKFKYWCEICQVGTYSQVVMESHKKGKKHVSQLKQNGEAIAVTVDPLIPASTTTNVLSLEDTENVGDEKKHEALLEENTEAIMVTIDPSIPASTITNQSPPEDTKNMEDSDTKAVNASEKTMDDTSC